MPQSLQLHLPCSHTFFFFSAPVRFSQIFRGRGGAFCLVAVFASDPPTHHGRQVISRRQGCPAPFLGGPLPLDRGSQPYDKAMAIRYNKTKTSTSLVVSKAATATTQQPPIADRTSHLGTAKSPLTTPKGRRKEEKKRRTYLFLRFLRFSGLLLENICVVFLGSSCRETAQTAIKTKSKGKDDRKKVFFLNFFGQKFLTWIFPKTNLWCFRTFLVKKRTKTP
jgi:hypothetical protein